MAAHVTLTIEQCGEPVTGVWCPSCSLPSGIAVVLLVSRNLTVYAQCRECERRL